MAMVDTLAGNSTRVCEIASRFLGVYCCDDSFEEAACDKPMKQSFLESYWEELGYPAEIVDEALSFSEVQTAISDLQAVQAAQFFFTGNGHVVLITGWEVDEKGIEWILIDDPFDGESLIQYEDFKFGYNNATWLWSWRIETGLS